jgi:hypothetical protein
MAQEKEKTKKLERISSKGYTAQEVGSTIFDKPAAELTDLDIEKAKAASEVSSKAATEAYEVDPTGAGLREIANERLFAKEISAIEKQREAARKAQEAVAAEQEARRNASMAFRQNFITGTPAQYTQEIQTKRGEK